MMQESSVPDPDLSSDSQSSNRLSTKTRHLHGYGLRELHGYGIPTAGLGSGYRAARVQVRHVGTRTLTRTLGQVLPHMVSHGNHPLLSLT